eukprot:2745792-Pleurochrysis_carterae.AAC.1
MAQRGSRPNKGFSVGSVQRSMNLRSYAVRERSQRCEDEERMRQTPETSEYLSSQRRGCSAQARGCTRRGTGGGSTARAACG